MPALPLFSLSLFVFSFFLSFFLSFCLRFVKLAHAACTNTTCHSARCVYPTIYVHARTAARQAERVTEPAIGILGTGGFTRAYRRWKLRRFVEVHGLSRKYPTTACNSVLDYFSWKKQVWSTWGDPLPINRSLSSRQQYAVLRTIPRSVALRSESSKEFASSFAKNFVTPVRRQVRYDSKSLRRWVTRR